MSSDHECSWCASTVAGAVARALARPARPAPTALRDKWCSNVHIRFFVGGAEGDAFGTIVYNGAVQAAHDTGAQVDYVFSGWDDGEDDPAAARGGRGASRRHRHDGPSGRCGDHAAGRAGRQGRHQDDVPERAGADGGRPSSAAAMSARSRRRRAMRSAPKRSAASASRRATWRS